MLESDDLQNRVVSDSLFKIAERQAQLPRSGVERDSGLTEK